MIQLDEIFLIGKQRCKVISSDSIPNKFWIVWLNDSVDCELSLLEREQVFKELFGICYMYQLIENAPQNSFLNDIEYRDADHSDSPDFYNLIDLTKFVEELRHIVFVRQLSKSILN